MEDLETPIKNLEEKDELFVEKNEADNIFFNYYKNRDYYNYLDDIRKKIYSLVIIFIFFFITGFFLAAPILKYIIKFFSVSGVAIVTNSPFQFIDLAVNTGLSIALILTLPFLIRAAFNFLKDGLSKKEKKLFFILLPVTLFLFCLGFVYGFGILYYCLAAIAKLNMNIGIHNLWDIDKYLSQMILTASLLGLIFEFPVVLTFLLKLKIINISFLKKNRRYAIALIFIFVSLLPPTDGLSLIIMALPLLLIYEITIFFNSFVRIKD